jgi:hypothetical protein
MLTPVEFPDVELWATGYLRSALAARSEPYAASVLVGVVVPDVRRDRMVMVRRDGGPRLDQIRESARLTVRVWGRTEQEASDLARIVSALLWASPDGDPVLRVSQNSGPSPIPDEQPQRLMSFDVVVRGTQI